MHDSTTEDEHGALPGEPYMHMHGVSGDAEPRGLGAMSGVGGHRIHDRRTHATGNNIYGVRTLLHRFSRTSARPGIIYKYMWYGMSAGIQLNT